MRKFSRKEGWLFDHRKAITIGVGVFVGLTILIQCLYPSDRLLPYATVDQLALGGWRKQDAAKDLDSRYEKQPVNLVFGRNETASFHPQPGDIGLKISNQARLEAMKYPWYMRLIPSSILWYGRTSHASAPNYETDSSATKKYVTTTLGSSCDVKPVNAGLTVKDHKVTLIPSSMGGTCEADDVVASLLTVRPVLTSITTVRIKLDEIPPAIDDTEATSLMDTINQRLSTGKIAVSTGSQSVTLESDTVADWLSFSSKSDKITVAINAKAAKPTLDKKLAPKVALAAGTTYVTTLDFQVVSQKTGPNGRTLDASKTGEAIATYLTGKSDAIKAATKTVPPRVVYTRQYSKTDTGISALFANFAKDHPGTYGVQYIELSGARRRAGYNADKKFVTASTYKLFAAYGTLKRIDKGDWKWSDQITGGKDAAKCFDDMIVVSDNACAQAFVKRIGNSSLDKDLRDIGIYNTTFQIENYRTTPNDLATFLAALQSSQLPLSSSSRSTLISAMKRNVYRQGIPAGTSATVADKVGFLWDLLHDAAIVYSPKGTYVLAVMSDKSSWANIAELTRQLEKLRG